MKPRPDPRDLVDAPFLDDNERAEAAWLAARDADPDAPAPSPALARDHAELADLLADLPAGEPDPAWQDAVLAAVAPQRAKPAAAPPSFAWWRWALGGGGLAAAGIALYLIVRPAAPPAAELQVATRRNHAMRGAADQVAVGDVLVVVARPRTAAELRVYRGPRTVVARCPDATCDATAATWRLELPLTAPVAHHVILVFGEPHAPADATMDEYLAAARAANARIVVYPTIDVR